MFLNTTPNTRAIAQEFQAFIEASFQDVAMCLKLCDVSQIELNSEQLIQASLALECFIKKKFHTQTTITPTQQNIATVKKDFIKRSVFLKYQNQEISDTWESTYHFTSEKQFIADVNNTPNEDLMKYTAFALFTQKGKAKHRNDTIFHLPKKKDEKDDFIQLYQNTVLAKDVYKREGFNLTDTFPSKPSIDWHTGYCLHCHKRNKDSCAKGLNEEKQGCPLKQDVSESIYLKHNNHHIASLAVIMRHNPFCIITGRRICNDCEEACIFQKQEPVDIQSIETQVLNDILTMPYGLEVYNLLLLWNPLQIKEHHNLQGKDILVAGLGPAGLFASYLFGKSGANVIGIDAINIEITPKIRYIMENTIKDVSPLISEPLTERLQSNIGGVMEYGITARWNKNYLDLLIGLILRKKNIQFVGSRRIGGLLNYNDVSQRYKFNHIALCVGSASPKIPFYINGLFDDYRLANGIMMASDFLMSLHINRQSDYLQSIQSPVYILGCGLTAIDTACEVRTFLCQTEANPQVKILYHKNYEQSPSYNINHLEFKKALQEGIEIIQNTTAIEVIKNKNKIEEIKLANGKTLKCKHLIIAIGTSPNHKHIQDFIGKNDVSLFGDCNPQYTGSVVKALASVRNNINIAIQKTLCNQNISQNVNEITHNPDVYIKNIENNLHEVTIESPLFAHKVKVGNVLKLQEMYKNSLAFTVVKVKNNTITLYIDGNANTSSLIKAIKNQKIHINGINCNSFPMIDKNTAVIVSSKTQIIFKEIFPNNNIILHSSKIPPNGKYLVAIEDEQIQKAVLNQIQGTATVFLYNKMNCMLGGICGRCIQPNRTYSCINNIVEV